MYSDQWEDSFTYMWLATHLHFQIFACKRRQKREANQDNAMINNSENTRKCYFNTKNRDTRYQRSRFTVWVLDKAI